MTGFFSSVYLWLPIRRCLFSVQVQDERLKDADDSINERFQILVVVVVFVAAVVDAFHVHAEAAIHAPLSIFIFFA